VYEQGELERYYAAAGAWGLTACVLNQVADIVASLVGLETAKK
jgi:hypothetical protein